MPEYLTPGIFVEEIERGPRPIEGVPTSTAAFLGETERGPLRPHLVTSYDEYREWFGGTLEGGRWMAHAVSGFFENGGVVPRYSPRGLLRTVDHDLRSADGSPRHRATRRTRTRSVCARRRRTGTLSASP